MLFAYRRLRLRFAWILVLPSLAFIITLKLKTSFGVAAPYDLLEEGLLSLGFVNPPAFNLVGVVIGGPLLAGFLAATQAVRFRWRHSRDFIELEISLLRRTGALHLMLFSGCLLLFILAYGLD